MFLNHGSFGAVPRPVLDRQSELRRELEANPIEFLGRRLPSRLAQVRRRLARYVGAVDPDALGLVRNTTTAINAVARSLPLRRSDEVIVTDHEYGALRILWEDVAYERGARVVLARIPTPLPDAAAVLDAVDAALTRRTRALFFSHVTSLSALVLPAAELCLLGRERDIVTIVDGAHAPGQLDLDLDALGADCYAGNAHKWLCAPKGAAFLHAAPAAREWLAGPVVSWGWRDGYQGRFSWSGTDDPTAHLCIPEAIGYQTRHRWRGVRRRCSELARETAARIAERVGAVPLAPPELQAPQMVALGLPERAPADLQRRLRRRFRIEIPVERLGEASVVRLSVQAYTTRDDCDTLVDALDTLIRRRARPRP